MSGRIRGIYFSGGLFLAALGLGFAPPPPAVQFAQDSLQFAEDTLLPYAVNIHRTPTQTWTGYGIYLGKGTFITAAHVVGRGWLTWPKVVIAGVEYPTQIVKEGSFESTDLTLLSVDDKLLPMRLRLRQMEVCRHQPVTGEPVVTVVPEGVVPSRVISPERIPIGLRRFSTAIEDVARTGNSGSGVFDMQQRCLLGIMSRKIMQPRSPLSMGKNYNRDVAKYFVPAREIAAFLPSGL
ncbi:trypsin-like peptidase domain-containing protein [Bradyrhizobium sp. CCBAU 11434]|uniref:trypsin-like peptidase domain-containing protein n=1 Tax=Bradyrhizobium sp. CCBAU 11434 TaxID=1630885 RepID=UPI0023061F5B|nr:trypsin-like peptidase domain-containing protein [Bradyrhizobium sp. CCBAU 11434]